MFRNAEIKPSVVIAIARNDETYAIWLRMPSVGWWDVTLRLQKNPEKSETIK